MRDKYLDLARELKKNKEPGGDGDANYNWCTWNNPQRLVKGTGRLGNKSTSGDHSDYNIINIGQNTDRSPGSLKLALIQTPMRTMKNSEVLNNIYILISVSHPKFSIEIRWKKN